MLITTSLAALALMGAAPQQYAPRVDDGPQRVAPRGSYAQSCSGEYVNQGRLYADCRDTRGQLRGTSIELNRCTSSDIANNDGLLVCGGVRGSYEDRGGNGRPGGGWGDGRPGGGNNGGGWGGGNNGGGWGRDSVTVYRDARFRGQSTTFSGEMPNLGNTGFNDAISSMEFRGTWEACTDAWFRGQCQTFTDSVGNLDRWGMNDRISSLRPVRRGGGRW